MSARNDTLALLQQLNARGIKADFEAAHTLRRAQITLHRWHELECGDSNDYKSWSIERDEQSGKPYMCIYPHQGKSTRYRISDKEAGAIRRVKETCERIGAHFYVQTDPRGCALYVSAEPMDDSNYSSRGIACVA